MKVGGSSGPSAAAPGAGRRAAAAPGFAPSGGVDSLVSASPASASSAVTGLDALLMLQEPEDAVSRRRRAVRRASGLLDGLDALKLAVLGEGDAHEALRRLAHAARERRADVEDPGLGQVLDAVETRAAVELAKRERMTKQAA